MTFKNISVFQANLQNNYRVKN